MYIKIHYIQFMIWFTVILSLGNVKGGFRPADNYFPTLLMNAVTNVLRKI